MQGRDWNSDLRRQMDGQMTGRSRQPQNVRQWGADMLERQTEKEPQGPYTFQGMLPDSSAPLSLSGGWGQLALLGL